MAPRPDAGKPDAGPGTHESAPGRILADDLAGFASRAGHDLLGPLNQAASLLAVFVKRYRNELDPQADVLLEHLGNAAIKMDTVVAGVRKYLDMAAHPPEHRTIDLNMALASALAALDPVVKQSGATITSDTLPEAECGSHQMATMFEILIDNAIKFRRPAEAPRVHVSASRMGDNLLIMVADNGMGIDPQYREDVFLPFRRLNGREYSGAGLGLATARLIARLQGGDLRIDSTSDTGTTVTVALPTSASA